MWPSYQPLVKPVCPCMLADMVWAMPVMAAVDDTEPEEASAVPDTAASPATSSPASMRPTCRVPLSLTRFTTDIEFPPVLRRTL